MYLANFTPNKSPCLKRIFIITTVVVFLFPIYTISAGQIVTYPPGIFTVDRIVLTEPHSLLEGAGRGVTILKASAGVLAEAPEPVIRNITLVGNGNGVGLTMRNTWSGQVQNVEIENYSVGMLLELTNHGKEAGGGKTLMGWPGALTEGRHWGSRVTLTELREIEICGPGDGILLVNRLPQGNKAIDGSFFTATTIWGGHIYVKGRALVIGNNVWNTKLFGTFIDITKGGGIFMEKDAWDLCLVGVTLDLSMKKRRWTGAEKIIVHSYRAAKSINHSATNLEKDEIIIKKQ